MATQAFKVQRGTLVIASGQATGTLTAGVDYDAPSALSSAFIKLTNSRLTGMGRTAGGGNQNLDDFTCRISNPGNLLTSIDFTRVGTANNCRVSWEIIEYVGAPGGDNEFVVRDQGVANASTGTTLTGSAASGISDSAQVCLWLTSQSCADTARTDWHEALYTGAMSGTTPVFTKLAAGLNGNAWASYAVVEFTGANWRPVQRIQFDTTATAWTAASNPGAGSTIAIPTTLLDASKAFIHTQYATSNDATGLDDAGDTVTIDSTTNLRLWNRVTTGTRRKVVWLIENTQSDGTARNMSVQHDTFYRANGGTEERRETRAITSVASTAETSLEITAGCDGGGTAYPRGSVDVELTGAAEYTHTTSDNGQEQQHAIEVVQWPQDPDSGGSDASGSGSVTGAGTTAATGQKSAQGTTSVTGAGAITALAVMTALGTASVSDTGATTAQGQKQALAAVSVSGAGITAAQGQKQAQISVTVSGTGSTAASGSASTTSGGVASVTGSGAITGQGDKSAFIATQVSGTGAVSATGTKDFAGTVQVTASGVTTASGAKTALVSLTISESGSVTATGIADSQGGGSAVVSGAGLVTSDGQKSTTGTTSVSAGGNVALQASKAALSAVSVTGSGNTQASGEVSLEVSGSGQVSGTGTVSGQGAKAAEFTVAISGVAQSASQGESMRFGQVTLSGQTQVTASGIPGTVVSVVEKLTADGLWGNFSADGRYETTLTGDGLL